MEMDDGNDDNQGNRKRFRSRSNSPIPNDEAKRQKNQTNSDEFSLDDMVFRETDTQIKEPDTHTRSDVRCVYVTKFKPWVDESHIVEILKRNSTLSENIDKIECKKLVPAKPKPSKLTFVSFKVTVPTKLFAIIGQETIWPPGTTVKEFVVRSKTKHKASPPSEQLRFNPFSIRKSVNRNQSGQNRTTNCPSNFGQNQMTNHSSNSGQNRTTIHSKKFSGFGPNLGKKNSAPTRNQREKSSTHTHENFPNRSSNQKNGPAPFQRHSMRHNHRSYADQLRTHPESTEFINRPQELCHGCGGCSCSAQRLPSRTNPFTRPQTNRQPQFQPNMHR